MFDRHFEAFLANTEPARQTHYRLRYQVYCRDTGWEDASRFPDQMERDESDPFSVAFLVRRRRSKGWIATMRFIRRPIDELPISRIARIRPGCLPASARDRTIEFSRLCVVGKYRRRTKPRSGEVPIGGPLPDPDDSFLAAGYRVSESWIFMGLIRAGWQWSVENGVDYWIFVITDALAHVIQRSGMDIEPVGDEVDHRGRRRPYLFDLNRGVPHMKERAPEVDAMFHIRPAYRLFSDLHAASMGVRRRPR